MATITGTDNDDNLNGTGDDDLLQGLEGNDTLDGGGGTDTLEGGIGDDEFHVHSLADTVVEDLDEGHDTAVWDGAGNYVLADNVEDLNLEDGATQATGNALDNVMFADISVGGIDVTMDGAGGNDEVWGGANHDTLSGGDGDDYVDGGGGGDTIFGGAGDDYVIGASFSFGTGWDDTIHGDDGNDLVEGFDGDDTLFGDAGSDVIDGYGGVDSMTGGEGADFFQHILSDYADGEDTVTDYADGEDMILVAFDGITPLDMSNIISIEQDGDDTVINFTDGAPMRLQNTDATTITADDFFFYLDGDSTGETLNGGADRDRLAGEAGNDELSGRASADQLIGGKGHDTLSGGGGADAFIYTALSDRGDRISDFNAHQGDVIDLSAIDSNMHKAGDQQFHFMPAFDGHAGEAVLVYRAHAGVTVLKLDVDGDQSADFKLTLDGQVGSHDGWML